MTRVLFVDDEEAVLRGLRRSLRRARPTDWEVDYAVGGEQARHRLEAADYDVVISDARMPGIDGPTLLEEVRHRWPRAIRVILSGQTDDIDALRSLDIAHQFLAKPCPAEDIVAAVDVAMASRGGVADERITALLDSVTRLPPAPAVHASLLRAMGADDIQVEDIVAILEPDAALTAKLLQLVNSPYFALRRTIVDLHDAVAHLGFDLIRSVVLHVELQRLAEVTDGVDADAYAERVRTTLPLIDRLAPPSLRPAARSAAALIDIGEFILALAAHDRWKRVTAAGPSAERRRSAELDAFGAAHDEVGAALLTRWGLPDELIRVVRDHHTPWDVDDQLTAIVHVADALAAWHLAGRRDPPALAPAALVAGSLAPDTDWASFMDTPTTEAKRS